jgi:outer membrane biogenesis lipoprotein LolB
MIKFGAGFLLGVSTISILISCATPPKQQSAPALLGEPLVSIEVAPWVIQGKIKATLEDESQNLSFNWFHQRDVEDTLRLSGPAGLGGITIHRTGETVVWMDGDSEQPLSALPVDTAFRNFLLTVPITDLAATLLGHSVDSPQWISKVVEWQMLSGYRLPRVMIWSLEGASARVVLTQLSFPDSGSG